MESIGFGCYYYKKGGHNAMLVVVLSLVALVALLAMVAAILFLS